MNFSPFGDLHISPTPMPPAEPLAEREVRRHFTRVWLCYALLMLLHLGLTLGIALVLRQLAPGLYGNDNAVFFYDSLPFYLLTVPLVAFLMWRLPKAPPATQRIGGGTYAILMAVACLFLVAGSLLGSSMSSIVELMTGRESSAGGNEILGTTGTWLALLFAGVLGPIAEELICRKVLIDSLHRYGDTVAILASATVFGLIHGNLSQCFYAFGLGLVFGYIYCRSGKLYLSILPHIVINCASILMSSLVLPRLLPLTEQLEGVMDEAALLTWMEAAQREWPALLAMLLYAGILYGGALLGLIFLILFYRRVHLAPSRYFLTFEDGRTPAPASVSSLARPALFNLGSAAFLLTVLFYFVLSLW